MTIDMDKEVEHIHNLTLEHSKLFTNKLDKLTFYRDLIVMLKADFDLYKEELQEFLEEMEDHF